MKCNFKKVLFGLSVSLVLAMAIGSFALGETQTPANTKLETQNAAASNDDTGNFAVSGEGGTVSFVDPLLTIDGGSYTISLEEGVTSNSQRIELKGGATVTLNGVTIDDTTDGPAITISGSQDVTILLADGSKNVLKGKVGSSSSNPGAPGIQKTDSASGWLIIGVPENSEGTGELQATGGYCTAGVGGEDNDTQGKGNTSNIDITGGVVKATGGYGGAGIGGGWNGSGSYITISDNAEVTAEGGQSAAGIGGGYKGSGSEITIKDNAEVEATGEIGGAGIGGGSEGSGSKITISDNAKVEATGGYYAAGIGSGRMGSGSKIKITGGKVTANGGAGAAGIGGGAMGDGNDIIISGGVVEAIGGYGVMQGIGELPGAGIGGGASVQGQGGEASGNKLDGNAVVLAVSGSEDKEAIQGFVDDQGESTLIKGIVFTGVGEYDIDPNTGIGTLTGITWDEEGTMYGDVTLSQDLKIPANLTVPEGQVLSIKEDKEVTLSEESGAKYIINGELQNNGTLTLPSDLEFGASGKVTTQLKYDPQGGTIKTNDDNYITYQDADSIKKYESLPEATKEGYDLDGWYTEKEGKGTKIEESSNVLLNQHILYANWVKPTPPTPTPPTPTPPGPEPTPEPTPDPSVNPDGGGSGSSSKTSDPFMGGVALALLGVATTGAILTRKLK